MASMNYTEQQSIPSMWRLIIFGGVTLMMGFVFLMVYLTEWDTMPQGDRLGMLSLLIGPVITLVLFMVRLDIRMTSSTFEYRVQPLRRYYKVIPFSKIVGFELRKPKFWQRSQGLGTHVNVRQTEMNFGGRYQLLIRFHSGRVLAVSTGKPQEMKSFLLNLPEGSPAVDIKI